jgi:hypothetical protein
MPSVNLVQSKDTKECMPYVGLVKVLWALDPFKLVAELFDGVA